MIQHLIDNNLLFQGFYDIDQQSNVSTILVKWYGFHHPEETIAYQIGLSDSSTDITNIQFNDVPSGSSEYHLHDLQLQYYKVIATLCAVIFTVIHISVSAYIALQHSITSNCIMS